MYYEEVFRELNKRGVKYIVVGGIALNLLGVPRATADLDVLAELSKANLENIIKAMADLHYKPRLPVEPQSLLEPDKRKYWIEEKNLKAFTFYNETEPYKEVDILLRPPLGFDEIIERVTTVTAIGIPIPVISRSDFITLKESAGRKQDAADIEALRKLENNTLD